MTRSRTWTLGTAAAVALVLAAGWFLLISPTRADAASIQEQTLSQQEANVQLAQKIEQLKVAAQDLPAQEAKLAEIQQKIPAAPGLPSFIRSLSSISDESNVVLVSIEPLVPATLSSGASVTATPGTETPAEGSGEVTLDSAPPSSVQFIQAQVTVRGGYFNTEQFLTKMEGLKRAYLTTGFDIAVSGDAEADAGEIETHLQIRIFFSPKLALADPAPTTVTN